MVTKNSIYLAFLCIFSCYINLNSQDWVIKKASIIIFSYDRAAQLDALLESIKIYVKNYNQLFVIYRSSSDEHNKAYAKCFENFKDLPLVLLKQGADPQSDFKPLVMQSLYAIKDDHMLFAVDDLMITDNVDLSECVHYMIKYQAFAFYLRLGENITESFMAQIQNPMPESTLLDNKIRSWQFAKGCGEWAYPNAVDGNIYPTNYVIESLNKFFFNTPNMLESYWVVHDLVIPHLHKYGLCYKKSKLINIPFNVVKNDWPLYYPVSFSHEYCLEMFNKGHRIDIKRYFQFSNKSPHVDPRSIELYWTPEIEK